MPTVTENSAGPVPSRRADARPYVGSGRLLDPIVLSGVEWEEYVRFGDEPENESLRMTYNARTKRLEIGMPTGERHESVALNLTLLVFAFARVRRMRIKPVGSTTWRRMAIGGAEGDSSFYISRFDQIRGRDGMIPDLDGGEVPPDLLIEVDVTNPGVDKLPIFEGIGIPEIWVWEDESIVVRRLGSDGYEVTDHSVELPGFPLAFAAELLATRADAATFELEEAFERRLRNEA
ncbi:Uma2 family endonuclease [Alienimonas chondri]|uniref:Putative restriction endonuclease domain-containing protein n=1 Tax=Alienimonas chondri TaxID=2681879 RepID=A0ABX1VG30_9PLAN|nr:Uma2 family endonuclease [Alienimonas chondri]NNJ27059.1 hypothetical protein [Alienimonas chondri]